MKLKKLIRVYNYNDYPKKVLNFKKSKWLKQQRYILRDFKQKYYPLFYSKRLKDGSSVRTTKRNEPWAGSKKPLLTFKKVGCSMFKKLNYLSRFFKNKVGENIVLKRYLNISLKKNVTKKSSRKEVQQDKIFKHFFNPINVLKFNYQIVDHSETKKLISEKKLKVNKKKFFAIKELKKGSILDNQKLTVSIKKNKIKRKKKYNLYPLYQYDPYLQSTVIIKNLRKLGNKDFSLMSSEFLNI